MNSAPLAVVNCGQLVTLRGPARPRVGAELRELGIIREGVLLVRDGRIEAVGSRAEVPLSADCEVLDARGRVVLPGFVDAHTHLVFAGNRAEEFERRAGGETYQSIAAAGGGILSTVRTTRAASEDELISLSEQRIRWFLRNGTTTLEVKSGYGLSLASELKILRVVRQLRETAPLRIVATFLGAHEIPEEFRGRPDEYATCIIDEMLPAICAEELAEFADIFCEPHIFDAQRARRILLAAKARGLKLRMHVDQLSDSGGAALAAELGAATADHLEQTGAPGIAALRRANVQPVLLPASVYALGHSRYPPARAMIDAGLAVVLATDFNPGSSPTPSMPMVLSLALTQMKMTAAEAISAATINAACSLGRGSEVGSLEVGKAADFVLWDCHDYRELAYYFGLELAHAVYASGRCVFERERAS